MALQMQNIRRPFPGGGTAIEPDEILPGQRIIVPDGIFTEDQDPFAREYPAWMYTYDDRGLRVPKPPKTPSKKQFDAWINADVMYYGDLLTRFRRDLDLYRNRVNGVPLGFDPDQDQIYTTAEFGIQVGKVVAMISGTPITVNYLSRSRQEREGAQAMEAHARWLIEQIKLQHRSDVNDDVIADAVWYLLVYGRMVWQVRPDLTDRSCPYQITLEDPATCFPIAGGGKYGMRRMSRQYTAKLGEVIEALDANGEKGLLEKLQKNAEDHEDNEGFFDDQREVTVTECDTRWSQYVAVNEVEVIRNDHEYGYVPYVYRIVGGEAGTAGSPMHQKSAFDGRYTKTAFDRRDYNDPIYGSSDGYDIVEKGVSFFHQAIPSILHLEELYGLMHLGLLQTRFPATIVNSPYPDPPEDIDLSPGATNVYRAQEQVTPAIPHPSPADIMPLISARQAEASKALLPPNFFGQNAEESNIAGFAQDSLLAAAKDRIQPYYSALEDTISDVIFMATQQFHDFGHLTDGLPRGELVIPRYNQKGGFEGGNKPPIMPPHIQKILQTIMEKATSPGAPLGPPAPPPPPPPPPGPPNPFQRPGAGAAAPPAGAGAGSGPPPLPMGGAQPPAMMPPGGAMMPPGMPPMGPPPTRIGTQGYVEPAWTMNGKLPPGDMPEFVISRELIEMVSTRPEVTINALSLNSRTTLINYLTQAVNGKMMSRETAMSYLPEVTDTLAEFQAILAEDAITNTDLLQAIYYPRSLYEVGDFEAWNYYWSVFMLPKMAEMSQMAAMPPGMAPPGGGGPPPSEPKGAAPIAQPKGQVANQAAANGQGPGSKGAPVGRPG